MRVCSWKACTNTVEVNGRNRDSDNTFCGKGCKNKFYVDRRRKNLKKKSVEYLGGECVRCGYDKHPAALVPHHIDPTVKEFAIGAKGYTRSWDKVRAELDKCILLCANCHCIEHADPV